MMCALELALPHGGDGMDFIYFLSALLIVALPLTVFTVLTYLVTKGYLKKMREKGDGRST
ncbi:MAG: hypothetical protein ACREME_00030 [Gemmatimonadales bacterium]